MDNNYNFYSSGSSDYDFYKSENRVTRTVLFEKNMFSLGNKAKHTSLMKVSLISIVSNHLWYRNYLGLEFYVKRLKTPSVEHIKNKSIDLTYDVYACVGGKEFHKNLNIKSNYELLTEMYGSRRTDYALNALKQNTRVHIVENELIEFHRIGWYISEQDCKILQIYQETT